MTSDVITDQSSAQARGERVRRLRNLANFSRQEMCKNGDFKIDTLIGWEVARHGGLTEKGAQKVLDRVATEGVICSGEWLLHGTGSSPTIISAINLNNVQDNADGEEYNILEEIALFKKHYPQAVDYSISDNSMSPNYNLGDHVAGIAFSQDELDMVIGQDWIVKLLNGNLMLRRVCKGQKLNCYTLVPTNFDSKGKELILANETLVFAAPIVWHRKRIAFK